MTTQIANVVFIVWRECVEALLVVGILQAWIKQREPAERGQASVYLWSGVGAGVLLAAALAAMLVVLGTFVSGSVQQLWQTAMEAIAAVLIVQMVVWMRQHGRTLKRDMEAGLSASATHGAWWGLFTLALVAVAREGSEAVIFLYGTLASAQHGSDWQKGFAVIAGLGAAGATYAALQVGTRVLSWRMFFRVTTAMLLCLAGALLVSAADNLEALEYLPEVSGRLWDSSHLLADTGPFGGLVSAMTGYRARPDVIDVGVLVFYWATVAVLFRQPLTTARAT